jgi:hypothetical protein
MLDLGTVCLLAYDPDDAAISEVQKLSVALRIEARCQHIPPPLWGDAGCFPNVAS